MGNDSKRGIARGAESRQLLRKYLTFSVGREDYGIAITRIREIIGLMAITAVPQAKEHIKGVVNLRGRVIPVIDLRQRFGLEEADYTERTCIVVVEIATETGQVEAGLIVDSVSEVLNVPGESVEPAPVIGRGSATEYIEGMAKVREGVLILLDIDRVLAADDIEAVAARAA